MLAAIGDDHRLCLQKAEGKRQKMPGERDERDTTVTDLSPVTLVIIAVSFFDLVTERGPILTPSVTAS